MSNSCFRTCTVVLIYCAVLFAQVSVTLCAKDSLSFKTRQLRSDKSVFLKHFYENHPSLQRAKLSDEMHSLLANLKRRKRVSHHGRKNKIWNAGHVMHLKQDVPLTSTKKPLISIDYIENSISKEAGHESQLLDNSDIELDDINRNPIFIARRDIRAKRDSKLTSHQDSTTRKLPTSSEDHVVDKRHTESPESASEESSTSSINQATDKSQVRSEGTTIDKSSTSTTGYTVDKRLDGTTEKISSPNPISVARRDIRAKRDSESTTSHQDSTTIKSSIVVDKRHTESQDSASEKSSPASLINQAIGKGEGSTIEKSSAASENYTVDKRQTESQGSTTENFSTSSIGSTLNKRQAENTLSGFETSIVITSTNTDKLKEVDLQKREASEPITQEPPTTCITLTGTNETTVETTHSSIEEHNTTISETTTSESTTVTTPIVTTPIVATSPSNESCENALPCHMSDTLSEILQNVESLANQKMTQSEDFVCSVNGSWISEAGGVRLDILVGNNSTLDVQQGEDLDPQRSRSGDCFMRNSTWVLRGSMPLEGKGMIIINGVNEEENEVASFIGECKVCHHSETVAGHWLYASAARDCNDQKNNFKLLSDLWRRETLHTLKRQFLRSHGVTTAVITSSTGKANQTHSSTVQTTHTTTTTTTVKST